MNRNIFVDFLWGTFFVLLQAIVLNPLERVFQGYIPVIYPYFILFYPFYKNKYQFLIFSFLLGIGIDAFTGVWGTNAFASVALAYFRTLIFRSSTLTTSSQVYFSFQNLQWSQFITFIFTGILLHQLLVYLLENFSFANFGRMMIGVGISGVLSFAFIMILALIFKVKNKI